MALHTNATTLSNLINPQVMADMINKKLVDKIRLAPLANVDLTLEGRPGNTITLPCWNYIGDANDVNEGVDITLAQLSKGTDTVTIKKVGIGVQLTDEAVLSGYGDPMGEAVDQIALSIASKVDNDLFGVLSTDATLTYTATGSQFTADDIADALVKFGEDIEGDKVILVSPATYAALRKADDWCPASEIAAGLVINGAVGMVHGCQVVVSNKLKDTMAKNAFIVKPGALAIYMKRGVMLETDRDIINKSTVITADEHFAPYLYDASKAIKLTHA